MTTLALITAATTAALLSQTSSTGPAPTRPGVATTQTKDTRGPRAAAVDMEALGLQVRLDRAGFSPGAIDGRMGTNTRKAQALYQEQVGSNTQAPADNEAASPVTTYTITDQDAAGPFETSIPGDLVQQATLPALSYTSMLEALAERFHATPRLLQQLNPTAQFAAGEQIQVPNVEPLVPPAEKPEFPAEAQAAATKSAAAKATGTTGSRRSNAAAAKQPNTIAQRPDVVVTVSKGASALTVRDASSRVIFYAPVTTGSSQDPLPIGEWKVNGVQFNPVFHYNPDLFWDADPSHAKAKIPAGPNNPVGMVWIDLSKEHYGIHGTPEPSTIGRTESHGCVRLTNWDALKLAGMVKPGTRVVFTE